MKNLADENTFFECEDALEIRKAKGREKGRVVQCDKDGYLEKKTKLKYCSKSS